MIVKSSGAVAAILLASGTSERFGSQNKLLTPFRGKPLARYTLELASGMDFRGGIFFVTSSCDVSALAADLRSVKLLKNPSPEKGLCETVRLGVEACPDADYFIFFPCDEPFLDAVTVQRILDEREPGFIVEPRCRGMPGNPCLFSALFREELLSLADGETPRLIKARHPQELRVVEVTNPVILKDMDDRESFERFENSPEKG